MNSSSAHKYNDTSNYNVESLLHNSSAREENTGYISARIQTASTARVSGFINSMRFRGSNTHRERLPPLKATARESIEGINDDDVTPEEPA